MEILNRDKQYVFLFKNQSQIKLSGLITLVGRHLVHLEVNSSLVKSRIHWKALERTTSIIQTLPEFMSFISNA